MTQRTFTMPIEDADARRWRNYVAAIRAFADENIQREGLIANAAPDMPPLTDGLQGFIKQPYRVLFAWIPPWSSSQFAGQYVVRLDTLTRLAPQPEAGA